MNNNYNHQDGGSPLPRDTDFGAFSEDHELREACSCAIDDADNFDGQDGDVAVIQVKKGMLRDH